MLILVPTLLGLERPHAYYHYSTWRKDAGPSPNTSGTKETSYLLSLFHLENWMLVLGPNTSGTKENSCLLSLFHLEKGCWS